MRNFMMFSFAVVIRTGASRQWVTMPDKKSVGRLCFADSYAAPGGGDYLVKVTLGISKYSLTGSLAIGLYSVLALVPFAALCLIAAARRLRNDTPEQRVLLARAAGEQA